MGTTFRTVLLIFLCVSPVLSQESQMVFPAGTVAAEVDTDGYVPNREAADAFAKRIPKFINDQLDLLGDESDDTSVFLYRYLAKALGQDVLETRNQKNLGSCVAFGSGRSVEVSHATEIFAFGKQDQFVPLSCTALYGFIRRNNLGAFEGATGTWAADALLNVGTLHQLNYPEQDLTQESPDLGRTYQRRGVPQALYKYAEKHKVRHVARVENVKQLRGLLQSGFACYVCSSRGFENGKNGYMTWRSEGGWATPRGTWMHCMMFSSYRGESTGRRGFLIHNSWRSDGHDVGPGQSYIGGAHWPEDMPYGSFWVDANTVQKMLDQGDTWSVAGYQGFPKRKITLKDAFTYPGGPKKELPESTPNYQLAP